MRRCSIVMLNWLKWYPVDRRDAQTLLPLIQTNVQPPGSTIITDGWSAYSALSAAGYKHYVVEHKKAFSCHCRDSSTGETVTMHTNRIEGAWKHAKDYFRRMKGTKVTQFEGHLCEMMWRWWDRRPNTQYRNTQFNQGVLHTFPATAIQCQLPSV